MTAPRILVTGSSAGIGRATATELLTRGAEIIVHGRTKKEVQAAQRTLAKETGCGMPEGFIADFSDPAAIRQMAAEIADRYTSLNVLVNNAGTYQRTRHLTRTGVELTFAVNFLAPFLLTRLLLPLLEKGAPARIVNVASLAHKDVRHIDWDNLPAMPEYDAWGAYALSKFADVVFTYRLARDLKGSGITANCLHPGVTGTHLLHAMAPGLGGISPEEAAKTSVYLALSDEVAGITGKYFVEMKAVPSSALSRNRMIQKRLWTLADSLTRETE
jgi:NAD(P)-dependent dehydrogenase (short-subunit alcohol dehydrogenase family)